MNLEKLNYLNWGKELKKKKEQNLKINKLMLQKYFFITLGFVSDTVLVYL